LGYFLVIHNLNLSNEKEIYNRMTSLYHLITFSKGRKISAAGWASVLKQRFEEHFLARQ
jgi:hypothetical protein